MYKLRAVLTCTDIKQEKQEFLKRVFGAKRKGIELFNEASELVLFTQ
jgi:hypothetical protein